MTLQAKFCRQHDITDRANVFQVHVFGFNVSTHVTLLYSEMAFGLGGIVAKFAIGNAISNNDICDRIHCKKKGKNLFKAILFFHDVCYKTKSKVRETVIQLC